MVIEITEQTPVEDYDALAAVLASLRARGAMIAVDDAGAGYASLRHLIALRPQFVKVDRALVACPESTLAGVLKPCNTCPCADPRRLRGPGFG